MHIFEKYGVTQWQYFAEGHFVNKWGVWKDKEVSIRTSIAADAIQTCQEQNATLLDLNDVELVKRVRA